MLRIVGERERVWNYTVPSARAHVLCHRRKHGGIKDQKRFRNDATGLSHKVSIHLLSFVMFFFLSLKHQTFSQLCVCVACESKRFISSPWYNFCMKIIVLCFKSLWYWRHVKSSDGEALMLTTKILLWSYALYKLSASWARTRKCLYFTYSSQCCVSCWMLSFYSQTL